MEPIHLSTESLASKVGQDEAGAVDVLVVVAAQALLLLAGPGAKVIVADINEEGGKNTAQDNPDAMSFFRANVAKEEDWHRLMEAAQSRYGRIDCLVNNAGTTYKNKV